jgi:hypothetical protein
MCPAHATILLIDDPPRSVRPALCDRGLGLFDEILGRRWVAGEAPAPAIDL